MRGASQREWYRLSSAEKKRILSGLAIIFSNKQSEIQYPLHGAAVEPEVSGMAKETAKLNAPKGRSHKATYASDKVTGGWLIRVVGPNAAKFAGREVPVTMNSGDEHTEKLVRLVWTGIDAGNDKMPGTGLPVALYKFEPKPKEVKVTEF